MDIKYLWNMGVLKFFMASDEKVFTGELPNLSDSGQGIDITH